ncbi:DUF4268 domain-containing protein [Muriicola sp. E247]|uniref:DUF4268 domain-containing protein n=1 Tax=Muriicola sp. E247 TaxID=3242730 RepID=UPI00352426F3
MFSKKESKLLREQFWISFGKSFPRKWRLYQTGIKGFVLKFHFDLHKAMVSLDIEDLAEEKREALWDKLVSLKSILINDYLPGATYDSAYALENNKRIARIHVQKEGVCIHDKDTWEEAMVFLREKMELMESFFDDYREYLLP